MANGAPTWLIAVPCRRAEALHDPASHDAHMRDLTPRHRRELLLLLSVAVSSTMSVLAVAGGLVPPAPPIDAAPLTIQFVSAAAPSLPSAIDARAGRPTTYSRSTQSRRPLVLAMAKPGGDLAHSQNVQAVMQLARADLTSGQARKGPGPLKRVLFGSGQYRVQPFPTIGEQ